MIFDINSLFFLGILFLVILFFVYIYIQKLLGNNTFLKNERNNLLDRLDGVQESRLRDDVMRKEREQERDEGREKILIEKLEKLENSREKLEQEQLRVIKKDEEVQKKREEDFSRGWNDHENFVLSELKKICSMKECGFLMHSNTSLPENFSGNLKPDVMISFLDQYIIFDAKKSKNPKVYIDAQVKSSAQKYKDSESADLLYSSVFFVIPEDEISQLEKRYFYEEGYSFFIISVSALLPTLMMLKKITEYKNIEDFNPEDRESIVNMIAQYDSHISFQNAVSFVLAKKSQELMSSKKNLPENFQEEIQLRKNTMKDVRLNPSEIKKIILQKPLHSSS